jgi:AraC-like DNA-binding protein
MMIMIQREMSKLSVTKIAPLIDLIKKKGIDINKLLSDIGLDSDILNSPDNKISLGKYHELFSRGSFLAADDLFGLHAGESFSIMSNILGYVMMNCPTTGEAFDKYIKYQKVTEDIKIFNIIRDKDKLVVDVSINDDELDQDTNLIDYNLAGFVSYCRGLTGKEFHPIETRFRHGRPLDTSEYSRIFKSRLIFNSEKNSLVIWNKFMQIPIPHPNNELLLFFEKHIDEIFKRMAREETYTEKVRKMLVKNIKGEVPSIKDIAERLSLSVRSLQERLTHEGTTYSTVLNSLRKDIALEYLKDESISISEISFLLGFSEPSAFHRSFKKWTNATPNMFRLK